MSGPVSKYKEKGKERGGKMEKREKGEIFLQCIIKSTFELQKR